MHKSKITKEEALSFLLTYLVVEKDQEMKIDQVTLFDLTNLAQQAADIINTEEGVIPHEVIESIANEFLHNT